ncbi:MAG: LuxR C-terminal-related transcriptional regulator [Ilumatobacter sp.]|uniref:LuxR C-terminal-related transcriptional regulator n=1 Tax=Ilumatobacter sp. TaxID=1967498 RepID=UPI00391C19D7
MPLAVSPLAVVGPAGSGRSVHTDRWVDGVQRSLGRSCRRFDAGRLVDASSTMIQRWSSDLFDVLRSDEAVVIHDIEWVHWCGSELIEELLDHFDSEPDTALAVTATGWPVGRALDSLFEAIARRGSLTRTGPLDLADFGFVLADRRNAGHSAGHRTEAGNGASIEMLHDSTAGMVGLANLALEHGWAGPDAPLPPALVDAVVRRVRRQPADVVAVAEFCSIGADPLLARAAVAASPASASLADGDELERACRASGLFDSERMIPLVFNAIDLDLTDATRRRRATQLLAHRPDESTLRSQLVLMLDDDSTRELGISPTEVAASALHLGDASSLGAVGALPDDDSEAELVRFGVDARMLRWERAAERSVGTEVGALNVVASALVGRLEDRAVLADATSRPAAWATIAESIVAWAHGDADAAITAATRGATDASHDGAEVPAGVTPAALAALVSLDVGDASLAIDLLDVAIRRDTGGPGERRFHHQLRAFASMQLGEYQLALDLVRDRDDDAWMHRDRLVRAAIDVALARRSGDMARLRDGWKRAEILLASKTVSWLFADLLIELLAAGARLGDTRRTGPLQRSLVEQLRGLPAAGPGATTAAWVETQVAVASQDWSLLPDPAPLTGGTDARSAARRSALHAWTSIGNGRGDDASIRVAADELAGVGDAWEASRLLGQAALDHPDPVQARALLESARAMVVAPTESHDGLVAAGLSEREADVARLVVEGNTHREIGATLFVSPKTVEHHVAKIRQRLGASSRAEMIARIRELGEK